MRFAPFVQRVPKKRREGLVSQPACPLSMSILASQNDSRRYAPIPRRICAVKIHCFKCRLSPSRRIGNMPSAVNRYSLAFPFSSNTTEYQRRHTDMSDACMHLTDLILIDGNGSVRSLRIMSRIMILDGDGDLGRHPMPLECCFHI